MIPVTLLKHCPDKVTPIGLLRLGGHRHLVSNCELADWCDYDGKLIEFPVRGIPICFIIIIILWLTWHWFGGYDFKPHRNRMNRIRWMWIHMGGSIQSMRAESWLDLNTLPSPKLLLQVKTARSSANGLLCRQAIVLIEFEWNRRNALINFPIKRWWWWRRKKYVGPLDVLSLYTECFLGWCTFVEGGG